MKNANKTIVQSWTKVLTSSALLSELQPKKLGILFVLLSCILKSRTSCLYKSADKIRDCVGIEHVKSIGYQDFIKFFQTGKGDVIQVAIFKIIVFLLFKTCKELNVVIDRTNWEFGKVSKNILCIGALYHGCFIPLVWTDLNKKGNSNMATRLALIKRLKAQWIQQMPFPTIHLSGDREFIGDFWLRQLVALDINFVIRIKGNKKCKVWINNGIKERAIRLNVLHKYLNKKGKNNCEIVLCDEYIANLLIVQNTSPNPDAPFLFLITNLDDFDQAKAIYKLRWKIECCFKHLKSNGFDLEKQGFTAPHKIEILLSILVLIYAIAIYEGIIIHQCPQTAPKIKRYKVSKNDTTSTNISYVEKSVFRSGLSKIEQIIANMRDFIAYIANIIFHKASTINDLGIT